MKELGHNASAAVELDDLELDSISGGYPGYYYRDRIKAVALQDSPNGPTNVKGFLRHENGPEPHYVASPRATSMSTSSAIG